MDTDIRKYRIFVASPGDVARERQVARDVVQSVSARLGSQGGFVLEAVGWETHQSLDAGRPQSLINPLVRECDVFVGILWSRFGTETGAAESGTAEEFAEAEKVREETGERPTMMVFFSDAPVPMERLRDPDGRRQFDKVLEFREQYQKTKGLAEHYKDIHEFERKLREQLEGWCAQRFPERLPKTAGKSGSHAPRSQLSSDYAEALRQQIRRASFIGPPTAEVMRRPEVEAVYIPVRVETLEARRREDLDMRAQAPQRTSFQDAWKQWNPKRDGPMVVLGGPGAGKTTLLKHIGLLALDVAEGRQQLVEPDLPIPADTLPVFVRLAKLGDLSVSVPKLIASCPPQVDQELPARLFHQALKADRCLLLLDGLDEAANRQRTAELSRWVERVQNNFSGTPIVVTSRHVGYRADAVLRIPHRCVSLAPLGKEEFPLFLRRWYEAFEALQDGDVEARVEALVRSLMRVLSDPERQELCSLAGTPLMLLIMALIHRIGKGLPERRVDLYDLCVDVLLEHWNKENDRRYIPAKLGRAVLRPLAFWLHSRPGRYSAKVAEIIPIIGPELERTPQLPERDPLRFLESVRDLSGLFTGQSEDEFGFLHPTFQEYLAAEHVRAEPGEPLRAKVGR